MAAGVLFLCGALLAAALAAWRLALELGREGAFPFGGLLGRWQSWFGICLALGVVGSGLIRAASKR